jgi:hypothetical protein
VQEKIDFYTRRDATKKTKKQALTTEGEDCPSTVIVSLSNDELDYAYWEKLGASSDDDNVVDDAF